MWRYGNDDAGGAEGRMGRVHHQHCYKKRDTHTHTHIHTHLNDDLDFIGHLQGLFIVLLVQCCGEVGEEGGRGGGGVGEGEGRSGRRNRSRGGGINIHGLSF